MFLLLVSSSTPTPDNDTGISGKPPCPPIQCDRRRYNPKSRLSWHRLPSPRPSTCFPDTLPSPGAPHLLYGFLLSSIHPTRFVSQPIPRAATGRQKKRTQCKTGVSSDFFTPLPRASRSQTACLKDLKFQERSVRGEEEGEGGGRTARSRPGWVVG